MDTASFPKYQTYLDVLSRRDKGILMVAVVCALALVWLVYGRFIFHRFQRFNRVVMPVVFYAIMAIAVVVAFFG